MHYDPEELTVHVVDKVGGPREKKFRLSPSIASAQRIGLGRIVLRDRVGKDLEFFTFGGTLSVLSEEEAEVVYTMQSEAPILPLTTERVAEEIPDQFAIEAEALISEARAKWGEDDSGFACRLAEQDALSIYIAVINSVLVRYENNRDLRRMYADFYAALHQEKHWLQKEGQWPSSPPIVHQLLQNGAK